MSFISVLLILIVSFSALADCRVPQGNSFVVLGEGQSLSIIKEGKSLANLRVQDQDGVGTCYANAASVMLKSVLPGNPDVSYLHAAIDSSTNGVRENAKKNGGGYWRKNSENKEESFADGGFICETLNALKKTGGACFADQSLLEKDKLSPQLQESVFKNLGKYFDALNKAKTNPREFENFRNDLILAVESINNAKETLREECRMQKESDIPLQNALSKFLGNQYFNMNDDDFCSQLRLEELKKLVTPDSVFEKDRIRIKPSNQLMGQVRSLIMADPFIKSKLTQYASGKPIPRIDEIKLETEMGKLITKVFNGHVQPKSAMPVCAGHKDNYTDTPDQMGFQFLRKIKEAKTSNCAVDNEALLSEAFSSNACKDPVNLELVLNAVKPLLEVGKEVNQTMVESLLNRNNTNAEQMKQILMPGCSQRENRMPLNQLSCATYTPCETNNLKQIDNTYFSVANGECSDIETAKTETRKIIHEGISGNRSLGVSVCTSFMLDPSLKTNFCKNKGPTVEKHAYHAMAVTGLRCTNGKVEYQLLNSWGKYHCPKAGSGPNSPLKCDKTSNGMPTGRFWVPEEILVDSMTGLSDIKEAGK